MSLGNIFRNSPIHPQLNAISTLFCRLNHNGSQPVDVLFENWGPLNPLDGGFLKWDPQSSKNRPFCIETHGVNCASPHVPTMLVHMPQPSNVFSTSVKRPAPLHCGSACTHQAPGSPQAKWKRKCWAF